MFTCRMVHLPGRALLVSFALLANLIATGVPVLHGLAHEFHAHAHESHEGEGAPSTPRAVDSGQPHGEEVHPAALHEDIRLLPRLSALFGDPFPSKLDVLPFMVASAEGYAPWDETSRSRAPPGEQSARAPPLA